MSSTVYLLRPDGLIEFQDSVPFSLIEAVIRQPDANIDRLDWRLSDHRWSDLAIRLALRYGLPCPRGLALDHRWFEPTVNLDLVERREFALKYLSNKPKLRLVEHWTTIDGSIPESA